MNAIQPKQPIQPMITWNIYSLQNQATNLNKGPPENKIANHSVYLFTSKFILLIANQYESRTRIITCNMYYLLLHLSKLR